jgi:hypothetical protein
MTKWICIQVEHHKDVGPKIEEAESNGWKLDTYQATSTPGNGLKANINHYLLFYREE